MSLHLLLYSFSIFFSAQHSTPHIPLTPAVVGLDVHNWFSSSNPASCSNASFCFNSTVISERKGRCPLLLSLAADRGNQLLAGADALITLLFTRVA